MIRLIWKCDQSEVANWKYVVITVKCVVVPLIVGMFIPKVGVLISFVGSVSVFFLSYFNPVIIHLLKLRAEIDEEFPESGG
jgi:amino acid permease